MIMQWLFLAVGADQMVGTLWALSGVYEAQGMNGALQDYFRGQTMPTRGVSGSYRPKKV